MLENINLDINTYSIIELEKLLKLKTNYTSEEISKKKKNLLSMISKSNIPRDNREKIEMFLDNVYNKLTNNLLSSSNLEQYDNNHFIIKNNFPHRNKITKSYTVDSLFRENYENTDIEENKYTSNDFIFQLPESVNKAISMTINSIEMPLTYYNISDRQNNNIFTISGNTIRLDDGLYSFDTGHNNKTIANSIKDEINNKLLMYSDISINISELDGKTKITNNNSSHAYTIDFNVDNSNAYCDYLNNSLNQKLGSILGFIDASYIIPTSRSITSENICNINYPRYVYIVVNDYQTNMKNYFMPASPNINIPNIIGRINMQALLEDKTAFKTVNINDYVYSQPFVREYFGPCDIKKLKIQLLDEYGRSFSLNNGNWSFVISFECLQI